MGALGEPLDENSRAFDGDADYLSAMRRSTWVYACCGAIADNFCRPRWWFEKATGKQKQREVEIPELAQLLRRPTPYHTGAELFEATVIHLLLTGKAFWYLSEMTALSMFETKPVNGRASVALDELGKPKLRNPARPLAAGQPKEIWYLRPDCVKPVTGSKGKLFDHFVYEPTPGTKYDIPADAIIYFRRFDPVSMTEGLGVIEAAASVLEGDQRASDWNRRFFKNSARPDFVLGTEQELNAEQIKRYSAEWKTNFGGQDRAHRVAFLGGGIKPMPLGVSAKDMEFINLRKFGREEILAMFRVPPAKVGIFEYANYANAKEQDHIFWSECMEPIMRRFADKVTAELVSRYDAQAEFAFEDMTPADLEMQSRIAGALVGNGVWSPNEARQELGLGEPYEGGEKHFVPGGMVAVEPPTDAKATADESADEMKDYEGELLTRDLRKALLKGFQEQEREVMQAARERLSAKMGGGAPREVITCLADWGKLERCFAAKLVEPLAEIGEDPSTPFDFPSASLRVNPEEQACLLARKCGAEVRRRLEKALAIGLAAGETGPALQDRIRAVFKVYKAERADALAREEMRREVTNIEPQRHKDTKNSLSVARGGEP